MDELADAGAVQEAGAFMVVLEAIPAEIAAIITKKLRIPTIGIGAGDGCSGQVLVQIDMTGNFPSGRHLPKFVKKYANVWEESKRIGHTRQRNIHMLLTRSTLPSFNDLLMSRVQKIIRSELVYI